jgi:hypothetical protein
MNHPTMQPTSQPTPNPTNPTTTPSQQPSKQPTSQPSLQPSNQPTSNPSNPSSQPSGQPSTSPTVHPTSVPTARPYATNWFFVSTTQYASTLYIVGYSTSAFFLLLSLSTYSSLYKDKEFAISLRSIAGFLNLTFWILFHYVILCARFNFWLQSGNSYMPLLTTNNELVWTGPEYFNQNAKTVNVAGCPSNSNSQHYSSYYNQPSQSECKFLFFGYNLEILNEGVAKFSVGLGLIIFLLFQILIIFVELGFKKSLKIILKKIRFLKILKRK